MSTKINRMMNRLLPDQGQKAVRAANGCLLLLSVPIFAWSLGSGRCELLLLAVTMAWLHNLLYTLFDFRTRFLFFLFHATMFLFLLGRPIIRQLLGADWVAEGINAYHATGDSVFLTLRCLYYSLLALRLGVFAAEALLKKDTPAPRAFPPRSAGIAKAALLLLVLSFPFAMGLECEKAVFIFAHSP